VTPRVVFGPVARLGDELSRASLERAFILSTPGRAATVRDIVTMLGDRAAGWFDRAEPHVPVACVDEAERAVRTAQPDGLVAFGGGSAIGLAKALALRMPFPIVAIPTTYSGSEMTGIWGLTSGGRKETGRDPRVAPQIVLYDAVLTVSLPPATSAASGMNAMAHAAEALYAANATDAVRQSAEEAARLLAAGLPAVIDHPDDLGARERVLRGAHLAGDALGRASMGLHHRLCHVLGGSFGLPHALTHAVLLPHVVTFNAEAAPEAMARLARAIGADDAARGLAALNARIGITARLRDLGLSSGDIGIAAETAAESRYPNPRPAAAADIETILRKAY